MTNNKIKIFYIFIIIVIVIGLIYSMIALNNNVKEKNYYNNKIDSLNHSIDSLESYITNIETKIDTVYKTKTLIKHIYEQKADSIWNQSADDDWVYYTNFLSSKFPSDSNSVKTN